MADYKPQLTIPNKGDPYYNTKKNGGYSEAIQGSPTQEGLDVLSNCVGYAYGRFNAIGNYGYMKYLAPVNAEQFINFMNYKEKGVTSGMTPKLGACAVWQKGTSSPQDGAGHVAIVEQINADGSIVTSESGYNAKKPFWTQKRTNSDGRWGQGKDYTFLGFIYNPAVPDVSPTPTEKFVVGDVVYFKGGKDYNSQSAKLGNTKIASLAKITKVKVGGIHPYHCRRVDEKLNFKSGGVYGWVDADNVTI